MKSEDKLCSLEEAEEFAKKRDYKYTTEETITYTPNVHRMKFIPPEEVEKILKELDGN